MIALREKLEVRQITKQHFESALKVVQPSLTRADIERFDRIARELKRAIA